MAFFIILYFSFPITHIHKPYDKISILTLCTFSKQIRNQQ